MPRKALSQGPQPLLEGQSFPEGSGPVPDGSDFAERGADKIVPDPELPLQEGADLRMTVDDANGVAQDDEPPVEPTGRRRAAAASAPQVPQSIGEALRRAREAAGLTLDDVSERTKIRPGILREVEADAHDRLPALTYSLGFVKAYARTVGMDPAAAAERYRRESMKGDPVPTMVDLQPLEEKRLPSRKIVAFATGGLVLALLLFWAWGAGLFDGLQPAADDGAVGAGAMEAGNEPVMVAGPPPGAVDVTPTVPPPVDPGAPVTLTAREDVWLRIGDGSETFFMGTMAPGQVLTLPPGRAWQLRTGRAGMLDVKVGVTAVPPLGGAAEQVRNVSLKPGDLLARPAPAAAGLAPNAALPAVPAVAARPTGLQAAPAG